MMCFAESYFTKSSVTSAKPGVSRRSKAVVFLCYHGGLHGCFAASNLTNPRSKTAKPGVNRRLLHLRYLNNFPRFTMSIAY
jgi:hypothetical protein